MCVQCAMWFKLLKQNVKIKNFSWPHIKTMYVYLLTTANHEETRLRIWNTICGCVKQSFLSILTKPTTASYKIREILPKTITFAGSNMLKVCSLVARDTLFHEFKNKIEICDAITEVNLFLKVLSLEDWNVDHLQKRSLLFQDKNFQ
jgi:hypothetical protein